MDGTAIPRPRDTIGSQRSKGRGVTDESEGWNGTAFEMASESTPSTSSTALPEDGEKPAPVTKQPQHKMVQPGGMASFLFQTWRMVIRPPRSIYSSSALGPESLKVLLPTDNPGYKRTSR